MPIPRPTFYFDLGSPFAYLAAERLSGSEVLSGFEVLSAPAAWQPVSLGALFKLNGRSSWSLAGPAARQAGMVEVQRRAGLYGLPPLRWPDPWPTSYLFAMRLAVYAFRQGRGQQFAMQAFRHAFRQGRDLGEPEHVLQAAGEAGLDPVAAEDAASDPEVKLALRAATDAAHALGVIGVPTIAVGPELFWGDDRLPDAALANGQLQEERDVG